MPKKTKKHHVETKQNGSSNIRDIILGGQDGLVNVLGLVLGVAGATADIKTIIIAGLAGTFAESISMAAVAYTSQKAARDFYFKELAREKQEMRDMPKAERQEIVDIYRARGFKGKLLNQVVNKITSNKKVWLETMMREEIKMTPEDYMSPGWDAFIVGSASVVGSLIPLVAFFFISSVTIGIYYSLAISALALFITGALKAKYTIGDWKRAGIEMMLIGMLSAIASFYVGKAIGVIV